MSPMQLSTCHQLLSHWRPRSWAALDIITIGLKRFRDTGAAVRARYEQNSNCSSHIGVSCMCHDGIANELSLAYRPAGPSKLVLSPSGSYVLHIHGKLGL